MKTHLPILCAVSLLAGCATGYHPSGWEGGYRDVQLETNVWRVTYNGNARSSPDRIQDFALLRASELCLDHGYGFFAIANSWDGGQRISFATPAYASTTGSAYGNVTPNGNLFVHGNSATTYYPGTTFTAFRPTSRLIIVGYTEKPEEPFTYNATFLHHSLMDQYQLNTK